MPLEGRRFRRRKKEDFHAEGYFVDHASDITPGFDRTDETFHLYGKDSPETDVQHNFSTLAVTVLDKYVNNAILDVLTGQDPDGALPRQYQVQDLTSVHVWANVKDQKNTKYIRSIFVGGWSPGMPLPSGDPNAKAQYVFTGNGQLARQFEGAYVTMKKVASGGTVALGLTPVPVPGESSIYAVAVKAINSGAGLFEQEEVSPTAAMVSSTGNVSFAEIEAQVDDLAAVTHAAVYVLQTGTGVYPNVAPDKLYA